jgi:glycosyltransferase involved in cell wall biosynthesis
MIKKVLIISPKLKATTSRIRLRGVVKYINKWGWEPVILTNVNVSEEEKKFDLIKVPYDEDFISKKWKTFLGFNSNESVSQNLEIGGGAKENLFSKLIYYWQQIILYPDELKAWRKPAVQAASRYIEKNKVDAILSSFPPVTPHLIGKDLKDKYDIPWIADMRDLWTDYSYYKYGSLRKLIEKKLEIKTLSSADCITTVSKPFMESLSQNLVNPKFQVIENGFDPNEVSKGEYIDDKFSITYTGQLYDGKRDPKLLFKALKELIDEGKINIDELQINFFGDAEIWLEKDIKEYGLTNLVNLHGFVKREVSLEKQRSSQMLLLLRWNNPHEEGVIPGKIFEYLAAKRPILSIGSRGGVVSEIIEKCGVGVNLVKFEEIKDQLKLYYDEFMNNGEVSYNGTMDSINEYSHDNMAKKFAKALDMLNKTL